MKVSGNGIIGNSVSYFHTPSQIAEKIYFYPIAIGKFICTSEYMVDRTSYDSFLILYVVKGSCTVCLENQKVNLKSGSIALVNCYLPHKYFTDSSLEILWFHFDGCLAKPYYDMLSERNKLFVYSQNPLIFENIFHKIFTMFEMQNSINESYLSKYITDVLTVIINSNIRTTISLNKTLLEDTISYIYNHLEQSLSLDFLAKRCSLSPYYFSRIFKKETGYTLHSFIVQTRINQAKYYLCSTKDSIKSIANRCGFYNDSTFCTSFKKNTGQTPLEYRNENNFIPSD